MNLVIRTSALGDVVRAGAITADLGDCVFLTRPAYAPLAARLRGVQAVIPWTTGAEVQAALAAMGPGRVIDLQGSWATRRLVASLGWPAARARKHTLRRLLRLARAPIAPRPPVGERYASAAGVSAAPPPWFDLPAGPRDALALVPGAAWATKMPDPRLLSELGRRWGGPVVVLGGPAEGARCAAVAADVPGAEVCVEAGFERTLAALARCRVVLGGDTGLVHLGVGAGCAPVVLFGPTDPADGFFVEGERVPGRTACSPCTRHGRARCPLGHGACIAHEADAVWARVTRCVG